MTHATTVGLAVGTGLCYRLSRAVGSTLKAEKLSRPLELSEILNHGSSQYLLLESGSQARFWSIGAEVAWSEEEQAAVELVRCVIDHPQAAGVIVSFVPHTAVIEIRLAQASQRWSKIWEEIQTSINKVRLLAPYANHLCLES